jgi:mRNA interferase MazF
MKRGEVWWVNFDPSVGTEIQKVRPAVIVSNTIANNRMPRVVVVPITSNVERIFKCHFRVNVKGRPGKAMVDQILAADKSRLKGYICSLSDAEQRDMDDALRLHFDL